MADLDHDLKNVLQVLKMAVTMLPTEKDPEGILVWLELLQDGADRCDRLMVLLGADEPA